MVVASRAHDLIASLDESQCAWRQNLLLDRSHQRRPGVRVHSAGPHGRTRTV